jgi:hypothetical protein
MKGKRFRLSCAAAGAAVAVLLGTAACGPSVRDVTAPVCSATRPEGLMLVAESVPTASQIPCIVSYPAGWKVGQVEVRNGRTSFRLDAPSFGLHALVVTLRDTCDLAGATLALSDEPGIERYDGLPSAGGDRLVRMYTFTGGCVTYEFRSRNLKPLVVDEAAMALGFLSRAEVVARYRDAQ